MCETSKVSRPWLPDCPSQLLLSFWSLTEGAMFRLISFRIHCFWCLHLGVSDLVHASNAGLTCLSVTWRNWRTYNLIQFEICSPNFERMRTSNNTCTKQKWIHNLQETSVPTCVPQITCWNGWSTNQIQPRHILGQSDWRASLSDNWHKLNGFALPKNKNITTSSLVICRSSVFCWKSSLHSLHPSPGASQELLGFTSSALVSAAWRPKTTKSNKELAPNRLAPCTEAQPAYVKWSGKLEMVNLFFSRFHQKLHEILGMIFSRNFLFIPIIVI